MFEIKSLAEKHDYPDLFTVRFAREKLYIGDTSYPIGQLSVDILKNDSRWNLYVDEIEILIEKYEKIDIETMGFPETWKDLLIV